MTHFRVIDKFRKILILNFYKYNVFYDYFNFCNAAMIYIFESQQTQIFFLFFLIIRKNVLIYIL